MSGNRGACSCRRAEGNFAISTRILGTQSALLIAGFPAAYRARVVPRRERRAAPSCSSTLRSPVVATRVLRAVRVAVQELIARQRRCQSGRMVDRQNERLTEAELHAFFDRLLPNGLAGDDVLNELAPDGWEQSPLVACFHPSIEQRYEEDVQLHCNLEALPDVRRRSDGTEHAIEAPSPGPTLEEARREYRPTPIEPQDELTELVGLCLWDVFSDNHDVIAADGRLADIGSFRGAATFLDEHLTRGRGSWRQGDYLRFYFRDNLDLQACRPHAGARMIFRRLRSLGR
jgi:hypothetical protein